VNFERCAPNPIRGQEIHPAKLIVGSEFAPVRSFWALLPSL